jgi:hypothetical protein
MAGTEQDLAALLTDEEAAALDTEAADAEAAAAADPAAAAAAAAEEQEEEEEEVEELVAAAPVPDWRAPAQAQEKLDALANERADVAKRFDDGDITGAEFANELARIGGAETDIKIQASRAGQAEDMRASNWIEVDVAAFLDRYPAYRDNDELNSRLDRLVREQQAEAQRTGRSVFNPAFLAKAHADIVAGSAALLGVDPAAIDPATIPAATRRSPDPPQRQRPPTPPTLARVPASDPEQVSGDQSGYAALDRLMDDDPLAYEDAMARLTPSQREGYLHWNGGQPIGL